MCVCVCVSTDSKYNNPNQTDINSGAERVGDITGQPPVNEPNDRGKAVKLANLFEGLEFPATKQKIRDYLAKKSPSMDSGMNEVVEAVKDKLEDGIEYSSVYDIEHKAGLVKKVSNEKKPYIQERALRLANKNGTGKDMEKDGYAGREHILPANERDVSPNTPKGEEV